MFPIVCDCGRIVEPCFHPGPCEACFCERAQRYQLKGAFRIGTRTEPYTEEKEENEQLQFYERGNYPPERRKKKRVANEAPQ